MDLDLFKGSGSQGSSSSGSQRRESPGPIQRNYFYIQEKEHPQVDLWNYEKSHPQKYYGKLFFSITAMQDMFIGSGEIDKSEAQLYDVFSYIMTQPDRKTWSIPGSSLKGCILTHLSLFLRTRSTDFFSAKEGPAKVFFSDVPMVSGSQPARKTIPARFEPKVTPDNAMFKMYKKEYTKDMLQRGNHPVDPGEERLQAIKTGNRFEGHIHFKQLNEYEIAMLVLAFGSFPGNTFQFKIGGAKNRGMGLVRFQVDFEKSFYTQTLRDVFSGNLLSFSGFQSRLEAAVSDVKQQYPLLEALIKKLQGEYGQ